MFIMAEGTYPRNAKTKQAATGDNDSYQLGYSVGDSIKITSKCDNSTPGISGWYVGEKVDGTTGYIHSDSFDFVLAPPPPLKLLQPSPPPPLGSPISARAIGSA